MKIDIGTATISPKKSVIAGSYCSIRYTYTAAHPIDDTGYIKIVFRYAGDFGAPQFHDPKAPNYCNISTTGNCRIDPRWDIKAHTRPWGKTLMLKVMSGYLNTGDKVTVHFGDPSEGSPGWQMQTFCEKTFELKTLVDPFATFQFRELPSSPTLQVKPGKPARALCIAPSQVEREKPFYAHLKLEDQWGNPVRKPQKIRHLGFTKTGFHTIYAKDKLSKLSATSNPIAVNDKNAIQLNHYWGDLHGQSEETIGSNSVEDYFAFARDFGLLDIAAHQGNDFQITDEFWKKINQTTRHFNKSGKFITFPGYEWSGNTPLGGDRNVWFSTEGGSITRSSNELLPDRKSIYPVSSTAKDLFRNLHKQTSPKPFVFAHVGGRYADISIHDPKLEWAVEAHSAWGTFEWMIEDALKFGYRVGICANSDGHKGRPGASYPGASKFGSLGGLTCVLAKKLDRRSLFEAIRKRHFYGTTGNRSLLNIQLHVDKSTTAIMGDIVSAKNETPHLSLDVTGSGPIETIELRNGSDLVERFYPYTSKELGRRIKIIWSGAEVRGRARAVNWDGFLKVAGNSIESVTPINFWNADRQPQLTQKNKIEWNSITTGGFSGVILKLKHSNRGSIELQTAQRNIKCAIQSIGRSPKTSRCGGLAKQIEIRRLPDNQKTNHHSLSLPLKNLRKGDNPIYIRMVQEDGHMAWSSPIYLTKD